jgi:PmbA protein
MIKAQELESFIRTALKSIEKGDVVASSAESFSIDFDMDQLKSVEDMDHFAIGMRLFENGKIGNSFVNSLSDGEVLLQKAKESASLGEELDFGLPSPWNFQKMDLFYPQTLAFSKEEGLQMGENLLKELKAIDKQAKINVGISRGRQTHYLANTSGFWGSYDSTYLGISANMILVDEDESILSVGDGDSSHSIDIRVKEMVENIEWRYRNALKKTNISSGYYPVLFAPEALGLLLEPIEIAANAKTLYKGISVLSDKLGKEIADSRFSIVDDPFYEKGMDSYPFDDEGVMPEKKPIIENGVFKNFIFDLAMAKKLNTKSTGHGSRGVSSLPAPQFSNLVLSQGNASLEEMIRSMDYGLLVCEFLGGGMSNVVAGDFSVNIELGYLIEKGRVKGRIKDAMISGNVYDVWKRILLMENKLHKNGSLFAPSILFDKISVAG